MQVNKGYRLFGILLIIILILLVVSGYFYLRSQNQKGSTKAQNYEQECLNNQGKWLVEYNECELRNWAEEEGQARCNRMGGDFNFCTSECRHNPDIEVCTTNCVPVCKF